MLRVTAFALFATLLSGCGGQELSRANGTLTFSVSEGEGTIFSAGDFVGEASVFVSVNAAARAHLSLLTLRIANVPAGSSATAFFGSGDSEAAAGTQSTSGDSITLSLAPTFGACAAPIFTDVGGGCGTTVRVVVTMPSAPSGLNGTALLRVVTSDEGIDATGFSAMIGDPVETTDAGVDASTDVGTSTDSGAADAGM